jgi:hypothetical protein
VSGIYQLEAGAYRWMAGRSIVILKAPATASALEVSFAIPAAARARRVAIFTGGEQAVARTYAAAGTYTLRTAPLKPANATVNVEVQGGPHIPAPPDARELGVVLSAVEFVR